MLLKRHITLRTLDDILASHGLLVLGSPSSFVSLRSLDIAICPIGPGEVHNEAIVDILKRAPNLHTLGMNVHEFYDGDTASAVGSLRTLRRLPFQEIWDMYRALEVLSLISSPLTHLRLEDPSDDVCSDLNVIFVIVKFSDTLQELYFSASKFPVAHPGLRCDNVTRLTVDLDEEFALS